MINSGVMPARMNETILVLILKKKNPEVVADLRSIALCMVLYKIIAKALANRLKTILPTIISDNQCAFILNRLIINNFLITYELVHYLKRKRQGKVGQFYKLILAKLTTAWSGLF